MVTRKTCSVGCRNVNELVFLQLLSAKVERESPALVFLTFYWGIPEQKRISRCEGILSLTIKTDQTASQIIVKV